MNNRTSTLIDDLKASVLAESIVSRVLAAKKRLPKETYRKLTNRIAELEQMEQIEDQANDINLHTGHRYCCDCSQCNAFHSQNDVIEFAQRA